MVSKLRTEAILIGLLLLTVAAILGEREILGTSLLIDQSTRLGATVHSDGDNGGASRGELIANPNALEWTCSLRESARYPYCGLELILDPVRQNGIDLSSYDRVKLWLEYEGDAPTVRFYLRNFSRQYSVPGRNDSTKYNQVEFSSDLLQKPVEFQLSDFFVANWWAQNYQIPPQLAHPEFDNIVVIEITTGSTVTSGDHHFKLHQIQFTGQALTTLQWYQIIMAVWFAFAFLYLVTRLVQARKEIVERRRREEELLEVTALLDTRSKKLEEMAQKDRLTGALNRQGIEEAIQAGLSDWRQDRKPMTLLIMDIDHFKRINDEHGHLVGDRVLSQLSELVQRNVRASDRFARWGGEEFVLVCRNTAEADGRELAEKLRRLVAEHEFDSELDVTVSIGAATLEGRESVEQLFARADKALYQAKDDGRNRTVLAESA